MPVATSLDAAPRMNMSQSESEPRPASVLVVDVAPLRERRYVNKSATSRSNVVYCR